MLDDLYDLMVELLFNQDSPVNKLLYAREIPRYKQLVERYRNALSSLAVAYLRKVD